jgi:hypothetical protein
MKFADLADRNACYEAWAQMEDWDLHFKNKNEYYKMHIYVQIAHVGPDVQWLGSMNGLDINYNIKWWNKCIKPKPIFF